MDLRLRIVSADREAQLIGKRAFGVKRPAKNHQSGRAEFQSSFTGPCVDDRGRVSFRMKSTDHHAAGGVGPCIPSTENGSPWLPATIAAAAACPLVAAVHLPWQIISTIPASGIWIQSGRLAAS